jgi:hypothetical protein
VENSGEKCKFAGEKKMYHVALAVAQSLCLSLSLCCHKVPSSWALCCSNT